MTTHPQHAFDVVPGEPQPGLLALIFRRVMRLPLRKPAAVPAALLAAAAATPAEGTAALGDRMLSQVRREYDPSSTAELAALRDPGPAGGVPVRPVRFRRPDGEIVIDEHSHITVRPVNGRYLGTQPRRTPPVLSGARLEAARDDARAAGSQARARYRPPPAGLLRDLLDGLRAL